MINPGIILRKLARGCLSWPGALSLVFIFGLFFPMTAPVRNVSPDDLQNAVNLSELKVVHLATRNTFKIAIGGDATLLERRLTMSDLQNPETLKRIHDIALSEIRPHRKIQYLVFDFATYLQKPKCTVEIVLSSGQKSDLLSCSQIKDNQPAYFHFSSAIPPGIYDANIVWHKIEGNDLGVYAKEMPDGSAWLKALSQRPYLSTATIVRDWLSYEPLQAIAYLGLALCLLVAGCTVPARGLFGLAFVFLAYLSTLPLAREFSGNDETAHLSMLRSGMTLDSAENAAFNEKARKELLASDFYRLNDAHFLEYGECPHQILDKGSCGITEGPSFLYSKYKEILSFTGVRVEDNPAFFLWEGRWLNVTLLLLFSSVVALICGEHYLAVLAFFLLTAGSFLGQFPTITNDVPMYLLGFLLAIAACKILSQESSLRSFMLIPISALACIFCLKIDRSGIAGLPVLLGLGVFFPLARLQPTVRHRGKSGLPPFLLFLFLTLCFFVLGLFMRRNLESFGIDMVQIASPYIRDIAMVRGLDRFGISDVFKTFLAYWKGLPGSFIWGHNYFPWPYLVCVTLLYGIFTYRGIRSIFESYRKPYANIVISSLALLFAIQAVVILSAVLVELNFNTVNFESYLKTRLSAPGLGAFLIPCGMGFLSYAKQEKNRLRISRLLAVWSLALMSYFLPLVFLRDLY